MSEIAGTTAGHNSKVRADIIREVCKELEALEAKRDSISEEIRSVKRTKIKNDLGMKIGDFDAARRLHLLEGDDRDIFLDTLHETFTALGAGEQLDFIEVQKRLDTPKDAAMPADIEAVHAMKAKNPATKKKPKAITRGAVKKPKGKKK